MTLPTNVARCLGYDADECNTCKRLAPADAEHQWWTGPWELEGVPCEMRIPTQSPDELPSLRRMVSRAGDQSIQNTQSAAL